MIYRRIVRPVLFRSDPERTHDLAVRAGSLLGKSGVARGLLRGIYAYEHPSLVQSIQGIRFNNPVGLAAGFDKDCLLMDILPSIGFGYAEVGSITREPYGGNEGKRLVRLREDRGILVNYGLKNEGAEVLKERLDRKFDIPIGVSIAKTNKAFGSKERGLQDWANGVRMLHDRGDYLTINLSCPNTADRTNYCEPSEMKRLLDMLDDISFRKPVFLKLRNDVDVRGIIEEADRHAFVSGFILTNLSKDRSGLKTPIHVWKDHPGGVSGPKVKANALSLVTAFHQEAGDRYTIIGCGGISSEEDAYEYIRAGASLVQLITGMIYGGPGTIGRINRGLAGLLERDGFSNVSEAVGAP